MPCRVIQWSTGNVGRYARRQILDRPEPTLAGAFVRSEAKDGKDAGDWWSIVGTSGLFVRD